MSDPQKSPEQSSTRKPLNWKQRLMLPIAVWLVTVFTWFVRLTCRITVVQGRDQIDISHARGGVMIPCGWHQRLLISGIFLAKPMLPIGIALNRYWQIKSWDKTLIPKPFAHFTVALGDLWYVHRVSSPQGVDDIAQRVGEQIDELTAIAEAHQK